MTDPMVRAREMAEKLRAQVDSGRRTVLSTDPTQCWSWGGEPIMVYRNPDGPDAANLIDELLALLTREAEVRGEERERAARIAENIAPHFRNPMGEAIAAAIRDGAPGGDGWQPIETAPDGGVMFLAWCPRTGIVAMCRNGKKSETWSLTGNSRQPEPTHWCPLPAPPAIRGDGMGEDRDG